MGKNILVFLDGTRNKPSDARFLTDTNVWKLYRAASSAHDGNERYAKYVRGVGTERSERVESPADDLRLHRLRLWNPRPSPARRAASLVHRVPKRLLLTYGASAVGWGVADRIREGYEFICRHYEQGDTVYLFGFSRGAFEARSLAGFIHRVGLLLRSQGIGPDARRLVDMAYDIYRRGDDASLAFLGKFLRRLVRPRAGTAAPGFRDAAEVRLHFVGVFDTVEALGIGELEAFGKPLRHRDLPLLRRHTAHHAATALPPNVAHGRHAMALHELRAKFEPLLWDAPATSTQRLKQVWFAGAHADVGGGYKETTLSDITLRWLAAEALAVSDSTPALAFALHTTAARRPSAVTAASPLVPHHAIQGDFFWATPSPRAALIDAPRAVDAMVATQYIDPSALERLLDDAAVAYGHYPHEKDYQWTRRLPGGDQFPKKVGDALKWIDARTVACHRIQVTARTMTCGPQPLELGDGWEVDIDDVRRAVERINLLRRKPPRGEPADESRRHAQRRAIRADLVTLVVWGQERALERLVGSLERRVERLARIASSESRQRARSSWLPCYELIEHAAQEAWRSVPAEFSTRAESMVRRIGHARRLLAGERIATIADHLMRMIRRGSRSR